MGLKFLDLDDRTRSMMLEELDLDEAADTVYISPNLSTERARQYPRLLRRALEDGDDDSLARELSGGFRSHYRRKTRSGGMTMAKMPYNAAQTLAEGEFNRYYIRGLCRVAESQGSDTRVAVYRARFSSRPRFKSVALEGQALDPIEVLEDLRTHIGKPPLLIPDVNSGLSVRLMSVGIA